MGAFLVFFLFGVAADGIRRGVLFLVLPLRADFVVLVAIRLSFFCAWMWISPPVLWSTLFSRADPGGDAVLRPRPRTQLAALAGTAESLNMHQGCCDVLIAESFADESDQIALRRGHDAPPVLGHLRCELATPSMNSPNPPPNMAAVAAARAPSMSPE